MKSLILEASSEHALIAETQGPEIHLPGGPSLSKILGAEVKKFHPPFDRIIIGVGPGSFTGIRVIAAMGQALAFGWKVPLFTSSSLSALAPEGDDFVIAFDARSGGIYCQIRHLPPQLLSLADASLLFQQAPLIASPHPAKILQRLPHLASRQWVETRPKAALLEQHATLAQEPLALHYLSHL